MSFTFAPGTVLGDVFVVEELLGQGGMGAVYAATQQGTGQRRALKVMHPHLVRDAGARARFEREAQVAAKIASDHVVSVIAYGVDEAERIPYLAMELLDGEDLAHRVEARGPLALDEVKLLARQLGHAVAAAHAIGVVHRDLKPGNVFLARPRRAGEPFTVKVLDFGIARVLADARMTLHGGLGSPLWMAPEQVSGGGEVTPGADVWAFALVVFYALTGGTYWDVPMEAPPVAALGALSRGLVVPASTRARSLCPSALPLGAAFDAWFARALAPSPEARFASIGEALLGLEEALPMSRRARLGRRTAALAVSGVVAALGVLAAIVWARREPPLPTKLISLPPASFSIGSMDVVDERPPQPVSVGALEVDATEVTVAAYARCVDAGRCSPAGRGDGCEGDAKLRGDYPVNCVTLEQAAAYCAWVGKRLPTETEWEYAARGEAARPFPWGSDDPRDRICWGRCDTKEGSCPVASFPRGRTPEGIFDLAGNVAEWTSSRYCPYASPTCPDERRVVRGGGFCAAKAQAVRSAGREARKPSDRRPEIGFRCVR